MVESVFGPAGPVPDPVPGDRRLAGTPDPAVAVELPVSWGRTDLDADLGGMGGLWGPQGQREREGQEAQ